MTVADLVDVTDSQAFGGKAAALGAALRAGLPVPNGVAISWDTVDAIAGGAGRLGARDLPNLPVAVRSSAVGEDSSGASFAGAHASVLGVLGAEAITGAIVHVLLSGTMPSATTYRESLGLRGDIRMGVVVQQLVDADVSGVMFTLNPVTGAYERVIEASWGLGEAVVSGWVTPDRFELDMGGRRTRTSLGEKDLAIRLGPHGTVRGRVAADAVGRPCLGDGELMMLHRLALECDVVYGSREHDIEFAFAEGLLWLLQRRPITRYGRESSTKF